MKSPASLVEAQVSSSFIFSFLSHFARTDAVRTTTTRQLSLKATFHRLRDIKDGHTDPESRVIESCLHRTDRHRDAVRTDVTVCQACSRDSERSVPLRSRLSPRLVATTFARLSAENSLCDSVVGSKVSFAKASVIHFYYYLILISRNRPLEENDERTTSNDGRQGGWN